jgi:hypothetical protein
VSEVGGSVRFGFFRSDYELKNATHITTRKMSMQQIMEMLVEMKATADADREEVKADKGKMAADREADKEDLLTRMENKIDANQKKARPTKRKNWQELKKIDKTAKNCCQEWTPCLVSMRKS